MATYFIRQRLKGPIGIISVVANSRQAAIAILTQSAAPGTEYEIFDASTALAATGTTGPTGPLGPTGQAWEAEPEATGSTGP
jgi:hypothetical protein